jgi:GAF domain-containing protein
MALISFIDDQRRWSSAGVGIAAAHMPQFMSFCTHAICGGRTTVVEDASRDLRLATNPLVKGATGLRHYAGVPLRTASGARLGTLSVLDQRPQLLTADQVRELERLAATTVEMLEARRAGASAPVRQAAAA